MTTADNLFNNKRTKWKKKKKNIFITMERNSIANKLHCQAKMPCNLWMLSTPKFVNIEIFAHFKHWTTFNCIVRFHILLSIYCFTAGIFSQAHQHLMSLDLLLRPFSRSVHIWKRPEKEKLQPTDGFGLRPFDQPFQFHAYFSIYELRDGNSICNNK